MKIEIRPEDLNLLGPVLKLVREQSRPKLTQEDVAARLTTMGLPMDRSAVSRIENRKRILTDIERLYFCRALRISPAKLNYLEAKVPTTLSLYEEVAEDDDFEQMVAED